MKRICSIMILVGFLLAYGTFGSCDFESATGIQNITDAQFYMQTIASLCLIIIGAVVPKIYETIKTPKRVSLKLSHQYKNIANTKN